jgi:hypothetical protein
MNLIEPFIAFVKYSKVPQRTPAVRTAVRTKVRLKSYGGGEPVRMGAQTPVAPASDFSDCNAVRPGVHYYELGLSFRAKMRAL